MPRWRLEPTTASTRAALPHRTNPPARSAHATRRYQQCRRHLKPMFKQMRAGQMPSAVASSIVEIASHMIKREYVKAHDAYIT